MAYVRLITDNDGDKAGDLVYRPATVARQLVQDGIAVDGEEIYEYGPFKEEATPPEYEKRGNHITLLPDDFPEKERLEEAGFDTIEKIKEASDKEILAVKYIGPKSLNEIREAT